MKPGLTAILMEDLAASPEGDDRPRVAECRVYRPQGRRLLELGRQPVTFPAGPARRRFDLIAVVSTKDGYEARPPA